MAHSLIAQSITVTVVSGTPQQVSTSSIKTPYMEFQFPTGNSGSCYVGNEDVTSSWAARAADSFWRISASEQGDITEGDWFDLSEWYIDGGTSGDTVILTYFTRGA